MKLTKLFTYVCIGMMTMVSCTKPVEERVKAESVTLDKQTATLTVGEKLTIEATVLPENAEDKTIMWTSTDTKIATVADNGEITAVAEGMSDIIATCNGISDTCVLTVMAKEASSITLDNEVLNLVIGETSQLTATVLPEDAKDKTVTWTTSDDKVATVGETGLVSAVAKGNAEITASCNGKEAKCTVTVSSKTVESITLDKWDATLFVGESITITATVLPEDAEDKTVVWSSSDTEIATVTDAGVVTAIAVGIADITAVSNGKEAKCAIAVKQKPVESVTLDKTDVSLAVGEEIKLTATILPEEAAGTAVVWTSSDAKVVAVSESGLVTAVAAGTATITAKAGEKTAECNVTVFVPVPKEGDFYYSDGTFSTSLNTEKKVIGVIFYVGDPTLEDEALKADHPECTHGLVVAIDNAGKGAFQAASKAYGKTVGSWIEENTTYKSTVTGIDLEDNYNKLLGYNNTKAYEAFNNASENSEWPVTIAEKVVEYRTTEPAPSNSSDWYIPSVKEMAYLLLGEANIDHSKTINGQLIKTNNGVVYNKSIVNASLEKIDKKYSIASKTYNWRSSTESSDNKNYRTNSSLGATMAWDKDEANYSIYRFILAF